MLFALDFTLLALTYDPKIYKTITNSKILNTGLWFQVVYSMVVTIVLMLLMASKRQQKWDFLSRMQQIDETLQNQLHITHCYEMYSRYIYMCNSDVLMYQLLSQISNCHRCVKHEFDKCLLHYHLLLYVVFATFHASYGQHLCGISSNKSLQFCNFLTIRHRSYVYILTVQCDK